MKKIVTICMSALAALTAGDAVAQGLQWKGFTLTGSLQTDILVPQDDAKIGTEKYNGDVVANSYVNLNLSYSDFITVGARFEELSHPLPGFENDFDGWGVPYFFATGRCKWGELTVGDFYEQFGSGLILRAYEERSLGIDNSLRGAKAVVRPYKGISIKMLGGQQRRYWEHNDSWVWGADAELNIDQWSKKMQDKGIVWMLGGSYVGKYEKETPSYEFIDGQLYKRNLHST